uniref:Carbohydrate sulfotransferase n=1 Tax=Anopheles atroparvus TaxID=41427 RepID=A0AAG5DTG8_ANOAO
MSVVCTRRLVRQLKKCDKNKQLRLDVSGIRGRTVGYVFLIILVIGIVCIKLFWLRVHQETVEEVNEKRLIHLQNACKRLGNAGYTNLQPAFYLHSKNHSLLYCLVFKSGTSSWLYNFNSWAGYTDYEIMHIDNLLLARQFYPKENRVTLMNSMEHSFSFIIVRHPFERLISAFEDRLVSMKNAYYSRVSRAIYRRYHPTGNGVISFRDFVQYILEDVEHNNNNTNALDIHWCPVNNLCTPCLARYDFIVKMETYDQDIQLLIRAAHLEGKVKLVHINHVRQEALDDLIHKYFSQLTEKQMDALYRIYETDFELFGYSADYYFKIPKALT